MVEIEKNKTQKFHRVKKRDIWYTHTITEQFPFLKGGMLMMYGSLSLGKLTVEVLYCQVCIHLTWMTTSRLSGNSMETTILCRK